MKGRPSHDIVAEGAHGAREPRAPRRGRARRRTPATAPGILLQTPHAFLRAEAAKLGISLPRRRATTPPGMVFLPAERRRAAPPASEIFEEVVRGGGADLPRLARRPDRQRDASARPRRPRQPVIRQIFVGARRELPGRDELRAQALRDPPPRGEEGLALGDPGPDALLRPVALLQDHRLQGDAERAASSASSTPTSTTRSVVVGHRRWSTRASRPTPSRRGRARTRTATSRTTARSTRCAATSTGCTRASR